MPGPCVLSNLMEFLKNILRKVSNPHPKPPRWARFMPPEKFAEFRTRAEAGITVANPAAVFDWEQGTWKPASEGELVCGLTNLAQICNGLEEERWQSEIAKFAALPQYANIDPKDMTYEQVKPRLKVRLYPLDMHAPSIVTAPYCEYFHSALVVDFPDHISLLSNDCVDAWGIPVHELFKVGMENVFSEDVPTISTLPEGSEAGITLFEGESFFTATHALMLDKHLTFDDELGLLVVIPNRHIIACVNPAGLTCGNAKILANLASRLYKEGPGSVTPEALWYRSGQFQRIIVKGNKIIVP